MFSTSLQLSQMKMSERNPGQIIVDMAPQPHNIKGVMPAASTPPRSCPGPGDGKQLGGPFPTFAKASVWRRSLNSLSDDEHGAAVAKIQAEGAIKPATAPMVGFDPTVSVPTSVSTPWAAFDAEARTLIAEAHHAAMQVEARGALATVYDHHGSCSSDPRLHTHLVIANRVQPIRDGKWCTRDSRARHDAVTGLSEG